MRAIISNRRDVKVDIWPTSTAVKTLTLIWREAFSQLLDATENLVSERRALRHRKWLLRIDGCMARWIGKHPIEKRQDIDFLFRKKSWSVRSRAAYQFVTCWFVPAWDLLNLIPYLLEQLEIAIQPAVSGTQRLLIRE